MAYSFDRYKFRSACKLDKKVKSTTSRNHVVRGVLCMFTRTPKRPCSRSKLPFHSYLIHRASVNLPSHALIQSQPNSKWFFDQSPYLDFKTHYVRLHAHCCLGGALVRHVGRITNQLVGDSLSITKV